MTAEELILKEYKREVAFGKLLGISNILGQLIFEKRSNWISLKYMKDLPLKPATIIERIHKDLMAHSYKFGQEENELIDMFGEVLSSLDENEFTNKPLRDKFILFYHRQQHEINQKIDISRKLKKVLESSVEVLDDLKD